MNEILFSSISINEFENLVQKCIRKVLSEKLESLTDSKPPDRCEIAEIMILTGASKSTIYKLTHSNKIPYRKFGRRLIFSRKEIMTWMEEQMVSATPSDEIMTQRLANSAKRKIK